MACPFFEHDSGIGKDVLLLFVGMVITIIGQYVWAFLNNKKESRNRMFEKRYGLYHKLLAHIIQIKQDINWAYNREDNPEYNDGIEFYDNDSEREVYIEEIKASNLRSFVKHNRLILSIRVQEEADKIVNIISTGKLTQNDIDIFEEILRKDLEIMD